MVVIPKPNKPDYSNTKAYRPIALLNCLGKVLEKLMASRLSGMAETHDLVHPDQIGGDPQRSAIDAAMALTHDVEMGRSQCLSTTALFLDVRGAFDNVSSTQLTSTMRQLGCPEPVVSWCRSFLIGQSMALSFDGRTDIQRPMATGIPQGSPASPIQFLLYLHPLFDSLQLHHPNIWSPSYIVDVALVAQGKTGEGNSRALEVAARTAFQWAWDNAVAFDDAKSEMLHFQRSRQDVITEETKIQLPHGTVVEPGTRRGKSDVVRWIGIFFDRKHTFKYHVTTKVTVATCTFNALGSLVPHETGLPPSTTRLIYQVCVTSRSDFGAEIWWQGQKNLETTLQLQQNAALRRILNAFRSTPVTALHNEAALPPLAVRLTHKLRKYTLHLLSLPTTHPVVRRCPSSYPIPGHSIASLSDDREYDHPWHSDHRPPSRLIHILHEMHRWLHPDDAIENTAHPPDTPWTHPPISTSIAALLKDEASKTHLDLLHHLQRQPRTIIAYTDGSQLGSLMGAGFYIPTGLYHPIRTIVPMGDVAEVFDVELRAIYECLRTCYHHLRWDGLRRHRIHIFRDNQAAITWTTHRTRGPGQETTRLIHEIATDINNTSSTITVHWVPGHTAIPGNDEADTLAKQDASMEPCTPSPVTLSWIRRRVREQHTSDWTSWFDRNPKPKTYAMPFRRRLDAAYTTLPCKLSSAILGLRTGHGYFLDCLTQPPTDTYPSRNCTCPLHPPQTPKHLLQSCPEYRTARETLRRDLKLGCLTRPHLSTILRSTAGCRALATFISASKVTTTEWAHSKLNNRRTERDPPLSLTTGWGTLLDDAEEHADHDAQRAESG
jgi:ribonuclease HI